MDFGRKQEGIGTVCRNIVVGPSANLPYAKFGGDIRGLIAAMRRTDLGER